ncbi:MAG: hypothetical protein AAF938_09365 [Myxococcota bacterium]
MADEPKKPRKIKDLKARLGRTIAPNTPGAAGGESKGAVAPPGIAPPGIAPPAGGVAPPKGIVPPGGVVAPKAAVPAGSPFAPKQPSAPPPSNDPFAQAAPAAAAGPQEVRLVLDDSAVDEGEVGKKRRGRNFLLIAIGAVVGILFGYASGSVMNDRKTRNNVVRDAGQIQTALQEGSARVAEAQRLVDRAAAAAVSNPPTVDYEAIDSLRQIQAPFPADSFSNRNYALMETATVTSIFKYYQTTGRAWTAIESIVSLTSGDERREQLNAAATAAGEARSLIGCVPKIQENRIMCDLGFVDIEEENGETSVKVRAARRSRRTQDVEVFTGQEVTDQAQYVMLVNSQTSQGVLGEQASLFNQYVREIVALKQLLTTAVEEGGSAENGVSTVAGLGEVFTL